MFLYHATWPLKSNTIAEIQATIWQCNLLWKERKSIILYVKAGFLILGNDFGLCEACSIYLLPENDPSTNNVFNLSASFNPGLIRLASLREFILETVVFSVNHQLQDISSWGRLKAQQLNERRLEATRHGILQPLSKQPKDAKAPHARSLPRNRPSTW